MMKINMSEQVFQWYKEELALHEGDCIRFYIRYGGLNSSIKGFSLGMEMDTPQQTHAKVENDGITFFIEDCDTWYFDDKDLVIDFNENLGEPEFKQAV